MEGYIVKTTVKNDHLIAKRREEIIKSAVDIFIKKGFHDATTKEIADRAKMSVGTMFQYVQDKQDILYLVCCHIHGKIEKEIYDVATDDKSSDDILKLSVVALFQTMAKLADEVLIMYRESASMKREALRSFLIREQNLCMHLEKLINNGIKEQKFSIDQAAVPLLAEDILVQAQMWSFRRWSIHEKYTKEAYIESRVYLLMKQLGLSTEQSSNE